MNLFIWLPITFLIGFVTMVLSYLFIDACEKI